jgi:hypothetical protein
MKRVDLRLVLIVCCVLALVLSNTGTTVAQPSDDVVARAHRTVVDDRPLSFWVARASTDLSQEECDKTVAALVSGLASDDNAVRVVAADALAVLGPRAKSAAKPLIAQLGDEQSRARADPYLPDRNRWHPRPVRLRAGRPDSSEYSVTSLRRSTDRSQSCRRPSSMPPKRGGRFNRPRAPIGLNSAARGAMLSLARRVC